MGTSLALALKGKCRTVHGVDPNPEARAAAAFAFDSLYADFEGAAKTAQVIILAAPVRAILKLIPIASACAQPGTLILDLGSTKRAVVHALDALPDHLLAVGGHPMCGKATNGAEAAEAGLFQDCTFVLCPTARTTPEALTTARHIVRLCGGHPLLVEAEAHDRAVAVISHTAYLLSAAYMDTVRVEAAEQGELVWELAASGFRDMTRLSGSGVEMLHDVLLENRAMISATLTLFEMRLSYLRNLLERGQEVRLRTEMERIQGLRRDWERRKQS